MFNPGRINFKEKRGSVISSRQKNTMNEFNRGDDPENDILYIRQRTVSDPGEKQ